MYCIHALYRQFLVQYYLIHRVSSNIVKYIMHVLEDGLCSSTSRTQNNALENNERGVKPKAAADETLKHVFEK